jgi:hypothetical protein
MKKIFRVSMMFALMGMLSQGVTSCSKDDDSNNQAGGEERFTDRSYGQAAIDACAEVTRQFSAANEVIGTASLTAEQEQYLRQVLTQLVSNVIIPTYTDLANDVEDLENTLNGLNTSTITQAEIDKACADFKKARQHWERSEAFLMGAASDFGIDPTIDSWPLDRTELLNYFKGGMTAEIEDESSILGFHALEFILFRNGQNRKVNELQQNDTYTNFTSVSGADELKYAQQVCQLLKERCFQLQVAWDGGKDANRKAVVEAAGLDYQTDNGLSYGENLVKAGIANSKSTFPTLQAAIAQVLSNTEGSCVGIANEVGTAKIANPFAAGDIAYVESPYSYNSVTDFQDNIRSCRNVWLGSINGSAADIGFHSFFANISNGASINNAVENAFNTAINKIGMMPSPFVKYCSLVWGKNFDDPSNWDSITSEE